MFFSSAIRYQSINLICINTNENFISRKNLLVTNNNIVLLYFLLTFQTMINFNVFLFFKMQFGWKFLNHFFHWISSYVFLLKHKFFWSLFENLFYLMINYFQKEIFIVLMFYLLLNLSLILEFITIVWLDYFVF